MVQQLVVALAVLVAALYCAWALTPARARVAALSRWHAALQPGALRDRLVAPLLRRARPAGGCDSCGDAPPATRQFPGTQRGARRP